MATLDSFALKRINIFYWKGVNTANDDNRANRFELYRGVNARVVKNGTIEKRQGKNRLGNSISAVANYGIFYFEDANASSYKFWRISRVGSATSVYYLNTSNVWTILTGAGTGLTAAQCSFAAAEKCCFLTNGTDANRYISSNGTAVVTSATVTGHLYSSPIANLINYYKEKLYIGNYIVGSETYPNGIMMSSKPLGIIALVEGDYVAPVAGDNITVTNTKYFHVGDSLEIYRGNAKVASVTLHVTAPKTESTVKIATITFEAGYVDLKSSDEIWANGTYTGAKIFRWAFNPVSGEDVKEYDTFKLAGGINDALTMLINIGDVMMIANKKNLAIWDDSNLKTFDLGIGCVSKRGYVKHLGILYFLGYDGIYATVGGQPELISNDVELYFKGATKAGLEAGAMGAKGMSFFTAIGDVTLYKDDDSVDEILSDVVMELNLKYNFWYVHTGVPLSMFAIYIETTNTDRLIMSLNDSDNSNYELYEWLYRSTDKKLDEEIPFIITTQKYSLMDQIEKFGYPKSVIVEVKRGSGVKCFISLDDEVFYAIEGEAVKGINLLQITSKTSEHSAPRCHNIRLSFREMSNRICKIGETAILYSTTDEEEESIAYN